MRDPTARTLLVAACIALAAAAAPAQAAAESCSFDTSTRVVTATIAPGSHATLVVVDGELWFGAVPAPCGGATTTSADAIQIAGSPGTRERLVLDQRGGVFGPGFTAEFNIPEIEIATSLGDSNDEVVIHGTHGDDVMAAGQNGVALNSDGDVDVTFSHPAFPLEIRGEGGKNFINGRGQGGAGLAFQGPMIIHAGAEGDELIGGTGRDFIFGGAGNDVLMGSVGNDVILGGPGDDHIAGGEGNDRLVGGPGADRLLGGFGNDVLDADDNEPDVEINGGPDNDTAFYDAGIDPPRTAVEVAIADPPALPPPPTPGECFFDPLLRTVFAEVEPGGEATLAVSGDAIVFGETPAACGDATTANTDTINVSGYAGFSERLVLDMTGGFFGPGATAEFNLPEIEISLTLGDPSDRVVIVGTSGDDTIAAGANGVSLNADGDVDVTFDHAPAVLEIRGGAGKNFLSGRGGFGAGLAWPARLVLVAGDEGDELNGAGFDDVLVGGAGDDVMHAFQGNDELYGGGGNDRLNGSDGNDLLVGGAGADELIGGFGDDLLRADDREADLNLNGGPGIDTAYYDAALDPSPSAVENRFPV